MSFYQIRLLKDVKFSSNYKHRYLEKKQPKEDDRKRGRD